MSTRRVGPRVLSLRCSSWPSLNQAVRSPVRRGAPVTMGCLLRLLLRPFLPLLFGQFLPLLFGQFLRLLCRQFLRLLHRRCPRGATRGAFTELLTIGFSSTGLAGPRQRVLALQGLLLRSIPYPSLAGVM